MSNVDTELGHRFTQAQRRQLFVRAAEAFALVVYVVGLVVAALVARGSASVEVVIANGRSSLRTLPASSLFEENRGAITVLVAILLAAAIIAIATLVVRAARRSPALSVIGIIAAGVVGTTALLGILTVGPFLVPPAVLAVLLALPLDTMATGRRHVPVTGVVGSAP